MPEFNDGNAITYSDRQDVGRHAPFQLFDYQNAAAGPGLYSDNPWYNVETLTQPIIQLELQRQWRMLSIWRPFSPFAVSIQRSKSIEFSEVFDMEPTPEPLGLRQIWLPSQYTDTRKQVIYFSKYGDKVALHEYDDLVTSYTLDGVAGLRYIARTLLSQSITDFMDIKIRNAYLEGPRFMLPEAIPQPDWYTPTGQPDFSQLDDANSDHDFSPALAAEIWLRMAIENVPLAQNPNGTNGTMIAVTSPLPIHQIQGSPHSAEWREPLLYANPVSLLRYEAGAYKNARYIGSPRNILWNCGNIKTQALTAMDYGPGDGAYEGLVDKVWQTGQPTNVENWIQLVPQTGGVGGADPNNIQLGDMVTIHLRTTTDFGVTGGVDFREGTARIRRVVAVNGNSIAFDKPLFSDFPAGSYVTKGVHVHATTFIGGPRGTVTGVGEPISVLALPPVDDLQEIYRFAWKGYFEMQLFRPNVFTIVYSAGVVPQIR